VARRLLWHVALKRRSKYFRKDILRREVFLDAAPLFLACLGLVLEFYTSSLFTPIRLVQEEPSAFFPSLFLVFWPFFRSFVLFVLSVLFVLFFLGMVRFIPPLGWLVCP